MTVYSFADALKAVRANSAQQAVVTPVEPPKETTFSAGLMDDYIARHSQAQLLVENSDVDDESVPVVSDYSGRLRQLSRAIMTEEQPSKFKAFFEDAIRERIIDHLLDLKIEMAMSLGTGGDE